MKKKSAKKVANKRRSVAAKAVKSLKPVGVVTHYYNGIKVAIVKFKKPISLGATVYIKGATTDVKAKIASMQYDHQEIKRAPKGKQIGIRFGKRVRQGDEVFEVK